MRKATPIRLSIVLPTYNRFRNLKQTLELLFKEFELISYETIVVDGGSTDGTLEYLEALELVHYFQTTL